MARRAIYQRTVDSKWVVIQLPADYHEADRLPVPDSRDPGLTHGRTRKPRCSVEPRTTRSESRLEADLFHRTG